MIKIYLVITVGFIILIIWIKVSGFAEPSEWEKFCLTYMRWVEKYPGALMAGECDIRHISNKVLLNE